MTIDREELRAWLRLLETPGVGRATARRLLAAFASPQRLFDASHAALSQVATAAQVSALGSVPAALDELTEATRRWLQEGESRQVVTLCDPAYPASLLATADPPLLLHAQGRIGLLGAPSLAIVGSRNSTPSGADNARAFAADLSLAGLTIVSGLALGIDAAAHEGGMEAPSGTIAVVGTGLDRVYPARHKALAHRIAVQGLLLSEYTIGMPPLPENFPVRNRIIAGLSHGTLVVEAALRSGSLITARMALDAGREVFAIPGSIHSPTSRGCHALIRQGAKLVEEARDILEELAPSLGSLLLEPPAVAGTSASGASGPGDARHPLLEALGHEPVTLDALIARTGQPAHVLNGSLLELELTGHVARLPGGLFQSRAV